MKYVDVDSDGNTLNSSSSTLVFSSENNADPNCSEIVYAGLYWSGRANPNFGETFDVVIGYQTGPSQNVTDNVQELNHNQEVDYSTYSLSISRQGDQNARYPRYTLSSSSGSNTYQFEFTNSGSNPGRYRIGTSGDWTDLSNQSVNVSGNNSVLTFSPISIVEGNMTFTIDRIQRNSASNGNTASYQNSNNWLRITANGTFAEEIEILKTLDKRKVKIKGPASGGYTELTANSNNILYPSGELGDMYVGFVDVTQYVKANGLGEYTVADMALTEGNGGNTGYYGHWGIVVVYENSKMTWRDVTVFDGFSFVQSPGNSTQATGDLLIDGFNAVQNGDVNLKLGVMAGEGDRGISGDFLEIRNAANTEWVRLSHPLNSTGNFFNSSIYTPTLTNTGTLVANPRNPNLLNNTGIDIAMWNVPNTNNSIIANSQTATTFRYGTNQDLFNIYAVAFAVDAYIPDVQGLNSIVAINGVAPTSNPTTQPGQEIEYSLDIRNLGSEGIENTKIVIPIPYTASFLSASSQSFFTPNTISQPYFDPALGATGSIVWELGEIPVSVNIMDILARLSYTLKTTEDCFLLANADCEAYVAVLGTISGKGMISQSEFNTVQLTHGFLDGDCEGEPIQSALIIPIVGAAEFVNQNCSEADIFKEFFFCNVDLNQGVSVNSIKNSFPIGTRFFNGPDPNSATEFTLTNPFPATDGIYYAIPPNSSDCIFQFRIIVTIVVSNPSLPDAEELTFCIGEQIPDLVSLISPSNLGSPDEYNVYFFTSEVGGVAQTGFQVNSSNAGVIQLWVAEGYSANCLGPRVPVSVTISPLPSAPVGINLFQCFGEGVSLVASATVDNGLEVRWFDQEVGGNLILNPVLNTPGSVTYFAESFNPVTGCAGVQRTPVNLSLFNCSITIEKSGSILDFDGNGSINVGDKIIYTFAISNLGNTPITNISLSDPKVNVSGGPISSLSAGSTDNTSFTAEHVLTQADFDFGSFTNIAVVSGTALGTILTASDSDLQTLLQSPALSITKTATESTFDAVGDVLNYTIVVTNTGNVTLSNIAVSDPLTGLNTSIASLAPLASQSIPTSYTVTQSDIDAGKVDNTASAVVGSVNVTASESVTATQSPALSITKTATESTFAAVGDILNYTIVVTNTGNLTLNNISVSDPLTGLNTTIASLAPAASQSIPTSYTVKQSDIDAGKVDNTASAAVGAVNVSASESVSATQNPALSITKTATESTFAAVGDVLNYTIVVTNTGNVTLENVAVSDPLTGLNTTIASLAPLASQSIPTSYTITQADIDAGKVDNTASAVVGSVNVSASESVSATQSPALSITKTATESTFAAVGDVLNYTIVVTNTGNVTLNNISVSDPLTGLNTTIASLAPLASESIPTSYTVTQSDIDSGKVDNTASAAVGSVNVTASESVTATQSPALSITKTATESTFAAVGDVLNYNIVVTNTGNVTLSNVAVSDPLTGLNTTIASLAPAASQSIPTSYTVTQADIDAGNVDNSASAVVGAVNVSALESVSAIQSPALSITKTATESTFASVGDVLNYTIVVTNTGNITLSNVSVSDPLTGLNTSFPSLAPGSSESVPTSYILTQADIDAGKVDNTASAAVGAVNVSASESVSATQSPALSITKTATESTFDAVGDVLNYTIVVTNTGNVTLNNISVSDPLTGLNTTIASLMPLASQSIPTTYTITQSDIDAGKVDNTASAAVGAVNVSASESVSATQSPALSITKTATESTFTAVGDVLNFTIVVTNTGNVTLSNVAVSDPLTGLNTTIASLAPAASQSIPTSYTVTQADIDAGKVDNTASAAVGAVNVSASESVSATQSPALSITKTATESTYAAVGDVLNYTIVVTNTGNVTLSNVAVTDPLTGLNISIPSLAPGSSESIPTSYTITQSDIDAGKVDNTASAFVGSVNVSASESVIATQSPALSITKTATESTFAAVGDVLNYTIVVTNTGNVTLSNVAVTDPLTGLNTSIPSLAPGSSESIPTSYTITQTDIDAGKVDNTASAAVGTVNVSASESVTATQSPALSITKTATESTFAAVGDVLNYTVVVTNTGNVTLNNISVSDPLTGLNTTIASLAPAASQSIPTSYTVTQADIDAGKVDNTASAAVGTVNVSASESVSATQSPALSITKTATESTFAAVGDLLNYTIVVTNTGNVTLSNILVSDPLTGLNTSVPSLAPGSSESVLTSYTVTQADIDAGKVDNTASAAVGTVNVSASESVSATQTPALSITKTATESTFAAVGDILNYTIVVTNTGNVTLSNVAVSDPLTGLNTSVPNLAPGSSESIPTSYTVTQTDIDASKVDNTASAAAGAVNVSASESVSATQSPVLSITKTATESTFAAVGDGLNYTIVVTNTGNVTLNNISVSDPLTGLNTTIASLAPLASESIATSFTVTQADIDAGKVDNTASAAVGAVNVSASESVSATQSPALSITKTSTESTFAAVGDILNYAIVVTNTGNVTLSNVSVTDPLTGLNTTIASLAPLASESIATSYTITQADIDAGKVDNTASAVVGAVNVSASESVSATQSPALSITKTATESSFAAVGDVLNYTIVVTNTGNVSLNNISVSDPLTGLNTTIASLAPLASESIPTSYTITQADIDAGKVDNTASSAVGAVKVSASESVSATQSPALSITKTATESTFVAVGDVLNYTIVVTNTGNVTLENIAVSDPLTGLNTTIASLSPLASESIPTSYTVTQADIDAGKVDNTASAAVGSVNVSASESVTATQSPALSITKTATESSFDAVGDVLNYTIVVTNTGNVTLSNVAVSDPLTGLNTVIASLAPLASESIPTSYTVTQADIDAGKVDNIASAAVGTVNVSASESVTATQSPALSITKTAIEASFAAVGDVLNYTIVVTNTGNVTLSNVSVSDPLTGLNTTIASLSPLASQSIPTSYTITQSEIDAGKVDNTASASVGAVNVSASESVSATQSPALSITKTATESTFAAIGDILNYTIVVTNTGNVTLSNVAVSDPLTGLNTTIASLAPAASQSISTSYTITQSDIDAGKVDNTASAVVGSVNVSASESVTATQSPALSITKTATESTFAAVGDVLNYTIVVTNTGNVTLSNVAVSDPLTGLNTTIASLAPLASQSIPTSYTVTQSDIDAGKVDNTASAAVGAVNVSASESVTATQSPALSITKTATEPTFAAVGDVLNYTIVVTNTGNVTLSNVAVSDPLTGLNTTIASLAPSASQSIPTSYTVTQADIDAGKVDNTASAAVGAVNVSASESVTATQSPALSITKTATESTFDAVGDVLNYTIVVTNTGNVTLSNVAVSDPLTGLNTAIASLAPSASQSIPTSYTVTQADIDAGKVDNTASAAVGAVNVSASESVTATQSPALSITKTATESTFDAVGDVLNYTIVVTNTGNVTLSNVAVNDPLTGLTTTIATLSPLASQSIPTSYSVTQADIDAGKVDNTASAAVGSVNVSASESVSATQSPALSITKTATESSFDAVGDVLNYTIVVTNTGNVTLNNISVSDPLTGLNTTIASLTPSASQSIPTSYTITQSDIDAGKVDNTASAVVGSVNVSASESVNATQSPALSITKTATESNFAAVGDVLNYTIVVTNTGNVTLNNISVSDPLTGLTTTIASLAPLASQSIPTSYTITQSDIDAGKVDNTASAVVGAVNVSASESVSATQSPALSITKTATESTFAAVGDVLNYTIVVTNTGNVTLSNIAVSDPLTGLNTSIPSLAPGSSESLPTSYTITQSDIDAGKVDNTASAVVGSVNVTASESVTATQSPALSITKTATESTFDAVGDVLNYTIVVTNTGNITLNNVTVSDPLTGLNTSIPSLAPGSSESLPTSYTITQSDIDAGKVDNTASAVVGSVNVTASESVSATQSPALSITKTATESTFASVGDVLNYTIVVANTGNVTLSNIAASDPLTGLNTTIAALAPAASQSIPTSYTVTQADIDAGKVDNTASAAVGAVNVSASESVSATQSPALSITKTATESSFAAVGDVLNYTIVVTNSGNVTLNNVAVTDPLTGLNTTIASLAPAASQSIPTSYTVTQADLDKGFVTNKATVSGVSTSDEPIEENDEVTVQASANPGIEVIKTSDTTTFSEIGQVITYTITVKNTGNITLTNLVVNDPLTGLTQVIPSIAPGQTIAINTEYIVQLKDLTAGSITNNVSVTGKSKDGKDVEGDDSVTIGASSTPIDAIDDDMGEYPVDFGGVLGNLLTNDLLDNKPVVYTDVNFEFTELAGIVGLLIAENGELSLIPGLNEPGEYRLKYTLREALNPTNSDEAFVVFKILENEVDLNVTKTSNGIEIYEGDEFEYDIQVSNLGETDAENVVIVDDLPNGLSYIRTTIAESNPGTEIDIAVNGSKITYTIAFFPAGHSILLKVKVRANEINSDKALQITNIVSVSSDEEDTNMDDNNDSDVNQIHPFFIPTVITPNGDGLNDRFEIKGLGKFETNEIVIFNRNGDHVFERKDYKNDWSAEGLVAGTYFFVMKSTDRQGKLHEFQGWIQVIKK
ncbi:DUF7507 domain-containing protein [Cognataquiflexum aquatile]|uniref:DUF7507 domain-containing protein n=1 Tax=Cognataquiflexum aquatile TaxID=2249427 RepID=UPI0018E4E701|nr:gliding motility-associated C-terminal domain-containing protein [Cognataquiflexum aquatile]